METARGYTVDYAGRAKHLWAMRDDDRRLLGVIELTPHPLASAELGYWLGAPFRGRGYMTEAARAVVDFGFDGLGLDQISWCAVVGNAASAVVARRTGFAFEGTRRLALEHRDHRLDGWFGSLLRTDDRAEKPGWPA
jgi:RimJ/RimL family protein N-acetyltransferase